MNKKVKKSLIFIFLGVAVLIFLTFISFTETKTEEGLDRAILDSTEILIEKAETDKERVLGLSGRHSLGSADGLLFIFPDEGKYGIWMKDMLFSIDIIWINSSGEVVFIEENVSPETFPSVFKPDKLAKFVLEVEAGTVEKEGWNVGSSFVLE